jgi:hypothetical protein
MTNRTDQGFEELGSYGDEDNVALGPLKAGLVLEDVVEEGVGQLVKVLHDEEDKTLVDDNRLEAPNVETVLRRLRLMVDDTEVDAGNEHLVNEWEPANCSVVHNVVVAVVRCVAAEEVPGQEEVDSHGNDPVVVGRVWSFDDGPSLRSRMVVDMVDARLIHIWHETEVDHHGLSLAEEAFDGGEMAVVVVEVEDHRKLDAVWIYRRWP